MALGVRPHSNTLHSRPCGCPRSTCMILVLFLRIPVHLSRPENMKNRHVTPQLQAADIDRVITISEMKGWFTPKNKCHNVPYTYPIQSFFTRKVLNVNYPAIEASIFLLGGKRWHGRAGGHEQPRTMTNFYHSVWSRVTILLLRRVDEGLVLRVFFSRMSWNVKTD